MYKGQFKDNNMDGHGSMNYENGNVYEGDWKLDLKCGKGIMEFVSGNVYEGNMKICIANFVF